MDSKFLRSEEHTSELQSLRHLVCRLLLEKKIGVRPCAAGRPPTTRRIPLPRPAPRPPPPAPRPPPAASRPTARFLSCFGFFFFLEMRPPRNYPFFPQAPFSQ